MAKKRKLKKITVKDIAQYANVGIGTVSRVLNNNPNVSTETRNKILNAIKELGYSVSAFNKSTFSFNKTVAILFPEMKGDFHYILLNSIDDILISYGYSSFVYPIYNQRRYDILKKNSENILSHISGLLINAIDADSVLKNIVKTNIPVVCVEYESSKYDSVIVDNYYGGVLAGDLFSNFDMEILVITHRKSSELESTVFDERLEGFQESLEKKGRHIDKIYYVPLDWESSFEVARRIFSKYKRCAIFTTTDYLAVPVIEVARTMKLNIGEDIRICGFDDLPIAKLLDITTVRQPIWEMGTTAAKMLIERMENKYNGSPRRIILKPELVVRKS